jgi:glutamine synthetase
MTNITRARKHNLTAASWSANGGSIDTSDLRDAANYRFGANVFSPAVQKERLSAETFEKLNETLAAGKPLDPSLADEVADAMKEWALEHGATHYTHMFQPLTRMRSPASPARS